MELFKRGLDVLASTGLVFPRKVVSALESGRESDYRQVWIGERSTLSPFEKEMMARYMQHKMLPALAKDAQRHKMGIAVGLSYVDSRKISADVRRQIGLEECPLAVENEELPQLFAPSNLNEWGYLCGMAEHYLERTLLRMKGEISDDHKEDTPYTFLGCLQGKRYDIISGLCTETKEFANGTVFIKDVWYMLRGGSSPALIKDILGRPSSDTTIEMPNCGGVWQAARSLNTYHPVAEYFAS